MSQERETCTFVILASQRTGSNLLRSLLSSHEDVVAYAEIFLEDHSWFEDERGVEDSPELVAERDADPVRFVEKYVFRDYEPPVRAVGFKLFYRQAPQDGYRLWSWLNERDDLRVLHLRRANLFRQFVSAQVAQATNVWRSNYQKEAKRSVDEVSLQVDPGNCERFMAGIEASAREATARLRDRPLLDITYEDLATDAASVLQRVQRFLGVPEKRLHTPLKKLVNRPLRELVTNYDQLVEHFAPTPWAAHFGA